MRVKIYYQNHRGEKAYRIITPIRLYFGDCEWHEGERWLLEAYDEEKKALRTFDMADIESWQPYEEDED